MQAARGGGDDAWDERGAVGGRGAAGAEPLRNTRSPRARSNNADSPRTPPRGP